MAGVKKSNQRKMQLVVPSLIILMNTESDYDEYHWQYREYSKFLKWNHFTSEVLSIDQSSKCGSIADKLYCWSTTSSVCSDN